MAVFAEQPQVVLDYLVIVDPQTITDVTNDYAGKALALVAARVGTTRLIDNMHVEIAARA